MREIDVIISDFLGNHLNPDVRVTLNTIIIYDEPSAENPKVRPKAIFPVKCDFVGVEKILGEALRCFSKK